MRQDNRELVGRYFDLRLSSDILVKSSSKLNREFLKHVQDAKEYSCLKEALGDDSQLLDNVIFKFLKRELLKAII
jgi:hypothetical protein